MAKQRPSVRKREREGQKRQRELKKSQKAAEKRERRMNHDRQVSPPQPENTDNEPDDPVEVSDCEER